MHLKEILSLRYFTGAGVSLGLTRRCPLSCPHCSTESTLSSEEHDADIFRRFVDSFTPESRPELISMSGGEALLRPALVRQIADRAHEVGTRSSVLSGMFFSNSGKIPRLIEEAISAVDHFSASIDAFHEREVPRAHVFRVLHLLLEQGKDLSLHIVGKDAEDPYLEDLIHEVLHTFEGAIPMFVNFVSPFGRAKSWLDAAVTTPESDRIVAADPCSMAAWPVVGFDGTIVACGNDNAFTTATKHLQLGHANKDSWSAIYERLNSRMMRAVRLFGPEYIADRYQSGGLSCKGYCQTCMNLSGDETLEGDIAEVMERASTKILESQVTRMLHQADAVSFARTHGIPRYAELVTLGA